MRAFGGIALIVVCLLSSHAAAKPVAGRRLGIGVGFGEPTAVTGYLSLAEHFAVDLALGVASVEEHDLAGHTDLLALFGGDATTHTTAAFYVGAGWFAIKFYDDVFAGARLPLGVTLFIPQARLALYGEVSLELLMIKPYETPRDSEFQASVGIRFFP